MNVNLSVVGRLFKEKKSPEWPKKIWVGPVLVGRYEHSKPTIFLGWPYQNNTQKALEVMTANGPIPRWHFRTTFTVKSLIKNKINMYSQQKIDWWRYMAENVKKMWNWKLGTKQKPTTNSSLPLECQSLLLQMTFSIFWINFSEKIRLGISYKLFARLMINQVNQAVSKSNHSFPRLASLKHRLAPVSSD